MKFLTFKDIHEKEHVVNVRCVGQIFETNADLGVETVTVQLSYFESNSIPDESKNTEFKTYEPIRSILSRLQNEILNI